MSNINPIYIKYFIATLSFFAGLGIFHAINTYFGVSDNNPVEEVIEEVIKVETGVDINLTPNTTTQVTPMAQTQSTASSPPLPPKPTFSSIPPQS